MQKILDHFERAIVLALMAFMMTAVLIATVDVGLILWRRIMDEPRFLMDINEMMEVFGFILMVIIGLELLETIKAYLKKHVVHVEVVLLVAIVAVARKVIIMDYSHVEPAMMLATAVLIVALAVGYFIVRRALDHGDQDKKVRG